MRVIDRVRYRLRERFRAGQLDQDVDDELGQWVDELAARHAHRGHPPQDARRLALAELGGVETVREAVRDQRRVPLVSGLMQDVRHAWRSLRHAPGLTSVILATLALGIGAATSIFSVVDHLLIEPLPYRDPSRLVFVWTDMTDAGYPRAPLSGPELHDLNERGTLFDGFGSIWSTTAVLTGDDRAEQMRVGLVTTNFFPLLGAEAAMGRTLGDDEEQPGAPAAILISWGLFQRRFGGDPAIVGQSVTVNGQPTTVVGVMPESFRLLLPSDAAVPDRLDAFVPLRRAVLPRAPRLQLYLRVVGRMKAGVTFADAHSQIDAIASAISAEHTAYGPRGRQFRTVALHDEGVRHIRPALVALSVGVGLLACIACLNVANLLVARASTRRRETAVRAALGAGTGRLLRQSVVEGLLLAALGTVAGLAFGHLALRALLAVRPAGLDRLAPAGIDWRAVLFAALVALLCGVVFSLLPVIQLRKVDLLPALKQEGRRLAGAARSRVRNALVVVQLALGVVLLVGAGLLGRTVLSLEGVDPGYHSAQMLTFRVSIPRQRYQSPAAFNDVGRRLQASIRALPSVTDVGTISHVPFDDLPNWGGPYVVAGAPTQPDSPSLDYRAVSPGWFETVGARLVAGRSFTEADDETVTLVIVVDERLARRLWSSARAALDKALLVDPGATGQATIQATVVGVVEPLRLRSLTEDLNEQVYFPVRQTLRNPLSFVVRVDGDPAAVTDQARRAVTGVDPLLPIYDERVFDEYLREASAPSRFAAMLAIGFAGAAVLLAAVGVFGIASHAVVQRRAEFGVRLALGARPGQLLALVLRDNAKIAVVGLLAGTGLAALSTRWLSTQIFGVSLMDPATYVAALGVLVGAVLLATGLPAGRAAAVSPAETLRDG